MKKRVISLILVLCTMLYCLPGVVNAAEETQEPIETQELAVTQESGEDCHSMTEKWFGGTPAKRAARLNVDTELRGAISSYFTSREGDFQDAPAVRKAAISTNLSATVRKEATTRAQGIEDFQSRTNIDITDAAVTTFCDEEHILYNEDGTVTVFVYEWTFFDYDDLSDDVVATDVSGHGVCHKITLKEVNGEYQILTDEYDDSDFVGLCTMNESTKQELVAMDYQPIETEASIIEALKAETSVASKPETRAASFYASYNPAKAVEYADKWVYHGAQGGAVYESYYNSAYYNFNSLGGDCANYTSQCIYAGGMPQVKCEPFGLDGWYYVNSSDRSSTWTGAGYLKTWMGDNRGTLITSASNSTIYMGSPVIYNGSSHAVICVGRNSAGTAIINSHNKDWYHGPWNYWSGATYSTVQLTKTDPSIDHDTHTYTELHYEAAHPHKEYKQCFCGAYEYTGTNHNGKVEGCETCYPVYVDSRYSAVLPCKGYLKNNANVNPYTSNAMTTLNGGYIAAGDECTITEVYTNGACKVIYPITGGTRTAYTPLSNFLISTDGTLAKIVPTQDITTYIRASTSSTVYGYASANDPVYKVGVSGSMTQIFYPLAVGGYKLAWVPTDKLPGVTTYTVSYNANGGSGAPAAQTKAHGATLTLSTTKPTRSGYTFLGWGTSASATTATYQPGGSYTANANITLYAVWKANTYTVTYNANGGTGAPAAQTKTYGKALTLSSAKPTREGYTFSGWGTSASATTATYQPGASYTNNASITLYAVWKANTYTVTYHANGGTGVPSSQTKIHDVTLTLSTTKPTRTGYTFLGWSTNKSATTATYQSGGSFTTNANTTLYAIWKINTYTVTYHANGGTGAPSSQVKDYGVALTLSTAKPTRTGYTFLGWGTSASATTATYQPGGSYTANASVTLYAIWKANTYTVSYNANGGTGAPGNQAKTHDVALTLSTTKPTKTGYTFLGWNTNKSATTATYQPGGSYTANASVTLYAIWKANTYTVSYNANGGSVAPSSQTKIHDVALILSTTEPTRRGYSFQGWATTATATKAQYRPGGVYTENKTITLYAVWKQNLLPALQVGSASAKAGEQVEVRVAISNNPGINRATLGFDYDISRLKLVSVSGNKALGGTFSFDKETEKLLWVSRLDTEYNGTFLTMTFDVLPTAQTGNAKVTVTYSEGDIRNAALETVNPSVGAGKVAVTAAPTQTFVDVPVGAWYYDEVEYAAQSGFIQGTGNGYFKPNMAINRAMLVTLLWRYAGEPTGYTNVFTDVPAGSWYSQAIAWAAHEGIVEGVGQNRFNPEGLLSREQMATLFYRYTKVTGGNIQGAADLSDYPDSGSISGWAKTAVEWAVADGLIGGATVNGAVCINPKGEATRAQLAVIFVRYVENVKD